MSRAVVENLVALLNRSFDGENTQSLLGNVASVRREDWDWLAPGGARTIRDIFEHAAVAKHIYGDYLFGNGDRTWDDVATEGGVPAIPTMLRRSSAGHGAGMRHSCGAWRRCMTRI